MTSIRFDNITGQRDAVAHLQNALRTGQISQAYLINGEKGSGKRDLAMAFAAALQCEERGLEPCGVCRSCRQILSGSHPDVITVTNELAGVQTKTNTIGVKTARFVQGDVGILPYEGPYKIYVIPDAQNMNPQAQNALLKTLEEPPFYAVFLLLSENTASFLPTVRSRCVTLQLRTVSEEDLLRTLEREGITGGPALRAARLSHGNPGRCRELAGDETVQTVQNRIIRILRGLPDLNSREIAAAAEELAAWEKEGKAAIEELLDLGRSWFRDILTAKALGSDTGWAGSGHPVISGGSPADPAGMQRGAAEGGKATTGTPKAESGTVERGGNRNAAEPFPGAGKRNGLIFQEEVQYISTIAGKLSWQALEEILEAFDRADRFRAANEGDVLVVETLLLRIRRAMSR